MQYQYDVRHDSARCRLEELHAAATRERLWRRATPRTDHWTLKLLSTLLIRFRRQAKQPADLHV